MGILELIVAIPKIIDALSKGISLLERVLGNDWQSKITKAVVEFDKLEKAKTDDERKQSAQALSNLFNSR